MKVLRLIICTVLVTALFPHCTKDHHEVAPLKRMFTVTIENVSKSYDFFESGVMSIPVENSGEVSNFLVEDYETVLNFMNVEMQKKKFKL